MDYDRKSTVSSFYGGRKGSMDRLNRDTHDSSSFYSPPRNAAGNAGYNRGSFLLSGREEPLKGGRDEEEGAGEGWDVYADFNNAGPRYSSNAGYQPLEGPRTLAVDPSSPQVELVTVPALGPEWQKSELKNMTKGGRSEKRWETRRQFWKEFSRGERGLCGKWFNRRMLTFVLFALCVMAAAVLGVCIPRVPTLSVSNATPLANATGTWNASIPTLFSRSPANFSFPALADIQFNTQSNYLPITFSHVYATVYDLTTSELIATGDLGRHTLKQKSYPDVQLPLNFTYVATNTSDQTWVNWYDGCRNPETNANGTRPGVAFRLEIDMRIVGLIGAHRTATQVSNADCPVELSIDAS